MRCCATSWGVYVLCVMLLQGCLLLAYWRPSRQAGPQQLRWEGWEGEALPVRSYTLAPVPAAVETQNIPALSVQPVADAAVLVDMPDMHPEGGGKRERLHTMQGGVLVDYVLHHPGSSQGWCTHMHSTHKVRPGQGWGSMAEREQAEWKRLRCDSHFCEPDAKEAKGTYDCVRTSHTKRDNHAKGVTVPVQILMDHSSGNGTG